MTKNIAKLYELADIKHQKTYKCPNCGSITAESGFLMFGDKVYRCVRCDFKISVLDLNFKDFTRIDRVVWVRPEFAAKNQLALIEWLVNKYRDLRIERNMGMYYLHIPQIYTGEYSVQFEEGLAGLAIFLWDDLTAKQKVEIRDILNDN